VVVLPSVAEKLSQAALSNTHAAARLNTPLSANVNTSLSANVNTRVESYQVIENTLSIHTKAGTLALTAFDDEAIEVVYTKKDVQHLPSFSIAPQTKKHQVKVLNTANTLKFSTGALTAVINKHPLQVSFYKNNQLLVKEKGNYFAHQISAVATDEAPTYFEEYPIGFQFSLSDNEKLLGGGERVLGMNRRGHTLPLYNKAHYGYSTESNQMYFGLPAVMSSKKYIVLFDNAAKGQMDLANAQSNVLQFNAVGGRSAYIVFAGDTYPELIENYVEVTGKQPLPARWALGSFASRFGYRTEQEVRNLVEKYQQEDFPLDALVLDLYWFGKDIKGHMGNLVWDREAFPTPEKMIVDLQEKGVKTIAITEPFILSSSRQWQSAIAANALALDENNQVKQFDFYFGNTGLVDVFNQQGRGWFNQHYQRLYDQGIAGWWGDLGEPEVHPSDTLHNVDIGITDIGITDRGITDTDITDKGLTVNADIIHNAYGHRWAEMVYNKQLAMAPEKRPFIMMRSGFAGSQRYGMMPWTGDVSRSWGGLQSQVELSLQMSLFGLAYTHSDLGGFAGGEVFDAELYTRWLQYGIFQPVFRPHGQDNIAPEPVFHDEKTKNILRKYLKLRYQLLPYNYTLAYQNSQSGLPLMRPLFFENENNHSLIDNTASYLWGDAFHVTPIVNANVNAVPVTLPKGVWFDYWNGTRYEGGQTATLPVTLDNIPVLVKAGAFVPMVKSVQSTEQYSSKALTLYYYADKSVSFSEGGKTHNAVAKGLFTRFSFKAKNNDNALRFMLSASGNGYENMPTSRDITLVIHQVNAEAVKHVKLNNRVLPSKHVRWDEVNKTLTLTFKWQHQPLNLTIKLSH